MFHVSCTIPDLDFDSAEQAANAFRDVIASASCALTYEVWANHEPTKIQMVELPANAPAPDHRDDTVDALTQAESFISGFEDDEMQEGIPEMLASVRAAILRAQQQSEFINRMAQFTTPEDEFEAWKQDDGTAYDDGITYEDADEVKAEYSDERLCDEHATFCEMIREARKLRA